MISYSTNWMGPLQAKWYEERGLMEQITKTAESEFVASLWGIGVGDAYTVSHPTTIYSGGRIDIYGLPPDEYYAGTSEYGLPIMCGEDWNALSDWLEDFASEELLSYDELIETFEKHYGRKIRWASETTKVLED